MPEPDRAPTVQRPRANRSLLVALTLAVTGTAAAQPRLKIAVLPFLGPQGIRAQGEVVRALRRRCEIVPQRQWDEAAGRLFAKSHAADDVAAVATDLGVRVVISGAVKSDGGFALVVAARNGTNGRAVDKLRYPLRGPRIDPAVLRRLAEDIQPLVDRAAETAVDPMAAPSPPSANVDDEPPPGPLAEERKKQQEESAAAAAGPAIDRPDWAPYIDASAGLLVTGRFFGFDQPGLPQFRSGGPTAGFQLDVTGYPLAFLGRRPGDVFNALTGLGLGVTWDQPFWSDSVVCTRDANGKCMPTSDRYATRESRLEGGLRWHWNLLNRPIRPELLVSIQYGSHTFSVDQRACLPMGDKDPECACKPDPANPTGPKKCLADVGPPDVAYGYVSLGLGTRVPLTRHVALLAGFHFHILLSAGAIADPETEFGPVGGYGLRARLGVEARVWRGLTLRLLGSYERFGLSFTGAGAPRKPTSGGAADQFVGGVLAVGWVY